MEDGLRAWIGDKVNIKAKGISITTGDTIEIKAQGITVRGTVYSVDWNGDKCGWYIEIMPSNYGYSYYKQRYDGGYVATVNGKDVPRWQVAKEDIIK